jgi:hypothetical protein
MTPSEWEGKNQKWKENFYEKTLQPLWGPNLNWASFVKSTKAPIILANDLKQEVGPHTWEVNSVPTIAGTTVAQLFNDLETIRNAIADKEARSETVGFQIHTAFEKPGGSIDEKMKHYEKIVSMYKLLNDYAAFKDSAKRRKDQNVYPNFASRMVGAVTESPSQLFNEVINPAPLEDPDRDGAMVGPYKYRFVGLRSR